MKKSTKRIFALIISVVIALCCIPTVFAESTGNNFEEGVVLVGFERTVEKVQDVAPELDIERVELAIMDNDYVPYVNTANFRFVKVTLTEKSKQATLDAIELLKTKPAVVVAEPFYTVYAKYAPGDVVVSLELGASEAVITDVLKDFEIENIRLITPGSETLNIYHVTFKEKTKEIVVKALAVLKNSDKIRIAEPNFIGEFTVVPQKGDADRDNRVTVMDATTIQRYLAQKINASDFDYEASIVSDNYFLTIIDATIIQQKLAGMDVGF